MSHPQSTLFSRQILMVAALGACLCSPFAFAAGTGTGNSKSADIEARYKADIAVCNSGKSQEDKATCIREAGAAKEEAERNRLVNPNESYTKNELARCQELPADQRDLCVMQMTGKNTTTEGSVAGGGILRETTITVPGTPPTVSPGTAAPVTTPVEPAPGLTPNPPATMPAPTLAPGASK
jgi:hypothetical protein